MCNSFWVIIVKTTQSDHLDSRVWCFPKVSVRLLLGYYTKKMRVHTWVKGVISELDGAFIYFKNNQTLTTYSISVIFLGSYCVECKICFKEYLVLIISYKWYIRKLYENTSVYNHKFKWTRLLTIIIWNPKENRKFKKIQNELCGSIQWYTYEYI